MPLKVSKGNMYDWVDFMHSHLGGECLHKCSYCYVQRNRFGVSPRYRGNIRLLDYELKIDYGKDKTIFIEHMNDLFAEGVSREWICAILWHCNTYPDNTYVFQTKNPKRAFRFIKEFPIKFMIGTTIESNRLYSNITKAPFAQERYEGMLLFKDIKKFVTIEPILDFDVDILLAWLIDINPAFINIGADSKKCNLPEPSNQKIIELIKQLQENNIPIRKKVNLERMLS